MKKDFIFFISRFVFVLSFFALLSLFISRSSFAQNLTPQSSSPQYRLNTNPDVPQNLNTYTQSVFIEILSTASCFLTGTNPINQNAKCLGIDTKTGKLGYTKEKTGGLMLVMGHMIGQTFNIPVSTVQFTNYLANNFGFSKKTYAQGLGAGIGFIGLTPILPIWSVFRNLSYLVFVFIFILLGLGIMFRINIDARTVMSIQNQIPKIIIGLILITFSYAIAGFLIDMMYVSIYLIIHLFDGIYTNMLGKPTPFTNINTNPIEAAGAFGGGIFGIAWTPATIVGGAIRSLFTGTIGTVITTFVGSIIGLMLVAAAGPVGWLGAILGIGAGGVVGASILGETILGFVAGMIAYLIIVVAIFSALFRTWFMLIKAYVYVLLSVIFAPLWIMIGILPIGTGGVGPWLRSLIANLAAFPVVVILFMIGKVITDVLNKPGYNPEGNFMPPLIGNLGTDSASAMGSLIGLGFILILPEALNITKSTLKAPDFKLTSAAGRAISVGGGVIGKPISGMKEELFGQDAYQNPRAGSAWLGRKVGKIGSILSGGGIADHTKEGEAKTPMLRWQGQALPGGGFERNIFGRQTKEHKAFLAKQATENAAESERKAKADAAEKQRVADMHAKTAELRKLTFDPTKHEEFVEDGFTHIREKKYGGEPPPDDPTNPGNTST